MSTGGGSPCIQVNSPLSALSLIRIQGSRIPSEYQKRFFLELSVAALSARDRVKAFVADIKKARPETTGDANLSAFVGLVAALRA